MPKTVIGQQIHALRISKYYEDVYIIQAYRALLLCGLYSMPISTVQQLQHSTAIHRPLYSFIPIATCALYFGFKALLYLYQ